MSAFAAEKYFTRLRNGLIVCIECRHAVCPKDVIGHLKGPHHRIKKEEYTVIDKEVRSWPGLVEDISSFEIPDAVEEPIPELPLYDDGLMCKLDNCGYVCRGERVISNHWREKHGGWLVSGKRRRGGLTVGEKEAAKQRFQEASEKVQCQRFFPARHGSRYFRVARWPGRSHDVRDSQGVNDIDSWKLIQQRANEKFDGFQQQARETIQEGERDEVNPWLERTGWQKYLMGFDWDELMASVEKPSHDPENPEPFEEVVWKAMDDIGRISQETVSRSGIFVRMEAVRDQEHQNRYMPLETYWDPEAIRRRVEPWKRILVFFVRTQRERHQRSPPYKFTQPQFRAFVRLIEEARRIVGEDVEESRGEEVEGEGEGEGEGSMPKITAIQMACLDFAIQLLNHEIMQSEYESALVCALAVLGVSETGWRGPDSYPPILSAIIKTARFMVVQKAVNMADPPIEEEHHSRGSRIDLEDSGYESNDGGSGVSPSNPFLSRHASPRSTHEWSGSTVRSSQLPGAGQASRPRRSCLDWVDRMMNAFMVRGSKGPMQWMLDLRTYGLKIHYNTTTRGHVEWCNGNELLYKSVQFNMAQFRGMVHGLVGQARQIMVEELLFCGKQHEHELPNVPWHTLRDNPTDGRPGWNFLQDQRTRLPVDGKEWLFDRIGRSAAMRSRFERPGSASGINRKGVEDFMASVTRFREKLLVLMHFTGGQPARGTELLSIRHSNTAKGGHRNIFIEDGMVVFVTRYHKGYALSGDVKIIHRYLPREVGELVVMYLWLVLPFQRRMQSLVYGQDATSAHMWPRDASGRKWTSDRMRRVLKISTETGLGHGLTIHDYREIAIGISRKFMRDGMAFQKGEGNEGDEGDEEDDIADVQAGHGSHVAGAIYAREIMEMAGAIASRRHQFRMSSVDWHRFLAFESATAQEWSRKRRRCPFEEDADEEKMQRWARLRRMNATEQFKKMMGKDATFRGIQHQAIEAIKSGVSPVVSVMPTGMGKSVLFMLPAWVEPGGTTIVVVPLIALREDMKRRCMDLGISCAEWNSRSPPDGETIVLVTPESAVSDNFMTFINRLKATRQLDRIIVDECHVILNEQHDFRPRLQRLGALVAAETQMVLLTATLPPSEEKKMWERMGWMEDEVVLFRMPTVRKNVRYSVVHPGQGLRHDQHDQVIADLVQNEPGKVVVYCNTVVRVKRMVESGLFECEGFHGKMKAGKKSQVLENFRKGKVRVVVATSALGMGVDIPDIRLIVHADEPRSLMDYAQESGRAGRDGQRSKAVVVLASKEGEKSQDGLVQRYLQGEEGCRRGVMDGYLDGREGRTHCSEEEEDCDICEMGVEFEEAGVDEEAGIEMGEAVENVEAEGNQEVVVREFQEQQLRRVSIRRRAIQEIRVEARVVDRIRGQLQEWKGVCVVCKGLGREEDGHVVTSCRCEEGVEAAEEIRDRRLRIQFEKFSCCFKCGVPQSICERYEEDGKGGFRKTRASCQFYGILTAVIFGLKYGFPEVWGHWISRLQEKGVDVSKEEEVEEYLGKRRDKGGMQGNNLVWEFYWVAEQIKEQE